MSFFGKNIRKIRNVKNMSQQAFADVFDLKRGTLGAYEEGRSEPKIDTLLKIANYFSITVDDLLTKELTVNKLLKFQGDLSLNVEEKLKEKFKSIPCITERNEADFLNNFENPEFMETLPCLQLPLHTQKEFLGYTVQNLEMTDHDHGLFPKDVVIGELIPKDVFKKIPNGSIVVVIANQKVILRRFYLTDKKVILRADHKSIEDITLSLKDIQMLWKIRYCFYHRIPEIKTNSGAEDIKEKLSFLEQEFLKLKDKL
ncbi:DNA-binding transcriptional regulator, XRE-family HTH domain [Pustulibacterium marinum]|uniref:DNA-binding transcriptional regulator, XRE-family HTH domain n=1 Tax=Pustulibacterium marinum TaxID=1224947 RepID=A0A1I7IDG0_9FLAO|nr:helix-turn-helix transcriptional regulator [Pustulibacterium marinum]SFU70951.1 DNA-binding transcriptional regulator, XRE-family HTH domain [Pustulibacterium marinum]